MTFVALAFATVAARQPAPPQAGLKIAVIAGEDAINVIQQKTAVAPIVEVRDRNDQPVAGAIVNFAIRSGRASFGGARTLSVTTDVAGRAVASGLTPTGTGALQISASAAFQGQTAAVTIAQTNVVTAAQAAAVSGAGSIGSGAGAAGGGSGGLNGLTIGLIAGGVGAGTLVAVNARDNGGGGSGSGSAGGSGSGSSVFTPTLYSMIFTPAVATALQCPQIAGTPAAGSAGPSSTSMVPQSDGSFSASLTVGVTSGPATPAVTVTGRATQTDVTGTMACIGGGGPTGTMTATGTPARYQGTWTFGSLSGTLNVVPQ